MELFYLQPRFLRMIFFILNHYNKLHGLRILYSIRLYYGLSRGRSSVSVCYRFLLEFLLNICFVYTKQRDAHTTTSRIKANKNDIGILVIHSYNKNFICFVSQHLIFLHFYIQNTSFPFLTLKLY